MIVIAIIFGCIIGALIGINAPMIPYTYSTFLAIAVVAALDSQMCIRDSTYSKIEIEPNIKIITNLFQKCFNLY